MRRFLIFAAIFASGLSVGWVGRNRPERQERTPDVRAAFVTFPQDGRRVVKSLIINRASGHGTVTDYAPADPDRDWFVEVGGVVYLCSPRE